MTDLILNLQLFKNSTCFIHIIAQRFTVNPNQPFGMDNHSISIKEREDIRKYFGVDLKELDNATFEKKKKALRVKYHPDNFEKFEDDTVQEMAKDRFQHIESLASKVEAYLKGDVRLKSQHPNFMNTGAIFAAKKLKIEIITQDKDLKYHLFGSGYKWLVWGDSFKIPNTGATIIIDEDHKGYQIGYRETIRMYLTFGENDSIDDMVDWLYGKIQERANYLIIAKEKVAIDALKIAMAIKKVSFLRLEAG